MNWIFLSVGAGNIDFEEAAERLVRQALSSKSFSKGRAILTKELNELIPELSTRIFNSGGIATQGYGYYSWKSRVAKIALEGGFGHVDGVALVDAGCEFYISSSSLRTLDGYFKQAAEQGVAAFTISTPESRFTKRRLFDYFPSHPIDDESPQFQSGILFIHGLRGLQIVNDWDEIVWKDVQNVDDSVGLEKSDFYAHRHDQSVLSLVLKSHGVREISKNPPGFVSGFRNGVRAFSYPIWWGRNRAGVSHIPKYLFCLGKFSQKFVLNRQGGSK